MQAQLFHNHPHFFRRQRRPPANGLDSFQKWGIECGDGWFALINTLAGRYEAYIEELIRQGVPKRNWPRPSQIKEKLGTLRFYVRNLKYAPKELVSATTEIETVSATVCETCGAPGTKKTNGYRQVACNRCMKAPQRSDDVDVATYLKQLEALLASRKT